MVSERELADVTAQRDALREQVTRLQTNGTAELLKYRENLNQALAERDALRAEVAMLREALVEVAATCSECHGKGSIWCRAENDDGTWSCGKPTECYHCADVRAALSASPSDWLARHDAEKDSEIDGLHNCMAKRGVLMDAYLARAEKAEAERDALAAQNEAGRNRLMAGQFDHCCGLSGFGIGREGMADVCPMCRVARLELELTRVRAATRKAALLEVYERVKNLRGCNAYDVIDTIQEMAEEARNG